MAADQEEVLRATTRPRNISWYRDDTGNPYTAECTCAAGELQFPDGRRY